MNNGEINKGYGQCVDTKKQWEGSLSVKEMERMISQGQTTLVPFVNSVAKYQHGELPVIAKEPGMVDDSVTQVRYCRKKEEFI